MSKPFPQSMDFSGYNEPSRVECEIFDLLVEGTLPEEIHGSWYQSVPDPQFPPMLGEDTYLSGDGMVRVLRFENGHVDFKQRYIQSERWKSERAARRSLHGLYRNPYTDDASVRGQSRAVYNTTPIFHGGRLLALKEDSHAMELDPRTLDTLGEWDYEGRLRSQTMTAHTRLDPATGELLFFGYEASGLASRDVAFCVADRNGELVREEWFEAPYCSMMHDFAVTQEHVIFPVFPTTADLARLQAGGAHWIWEPSRPTFVGIMPRQGSVNDMRWFRGPACSAYHFMNAHTEGSRVHLDFTYGKVNPFPFIQAASGLQVRPQDMGGQFVRWTFNLARPGERWEEYVLGPAGDMPRIAEKDMLVDYAVGYYQSFDPSVGPPLLAGPVGAGFNTILRIELASGKLTRLPMDRRSTVQEHVHIPSKQPGHEGYLAFLVDLHDVYQSEMFVVEAARLERGPLARIRIPLRLRVGVHGNWVPT
ncbi:MAG TPA: carotenoid oxygenase family protein [Steroidobacteraceae bacterium]|nr:carotenoid oxygenase family protein [Steroidobacteraceae bacterium]